MILIGKSLGKKLDEKFCPKTVRELDRYEILGIWQYKNYHSIYLTVYLYRSCLVLATGLLNEIVKLEKAALIEKLLFKI
jgi:hypothetical protein